MRQRLRYTVLKSWSGRKVVIDNYQKRFHALKRRIFTWADVVHDAGLDRAHGYRMVMITLTYDKNGVRTQAAEWKAGHLRAFMKRLKEYLGDRLAACALVGEVQPVSGNIHYHVLVVFKGGCHIPYPDREFRDKKGRLQPRMWPYGDSGVDVAKSVYYLCKYVGKEKQKDFDRFPFGAHAWSVYIRGTSHRLALRYQSLKDWARRLVDTYGWDSLKDPEMQPNFWEGSEDRLWYYGGYLTADLALSV